MSLLVLFLRRFVGKLLGHKNLTDLEYEVAVIKASSADAEGSTVEIVVSNL